MALGDDGVKSLHDDPCAKSMGANGHVVYDVVGGAQNIHGDSWGWIQRIAPGRAYEFGWDFRKGPDQTLAKLDKFIDEVRAKHGVNRVALVAHSCGGLLSRWYIADPARARKVARVANFGSPWWGAAKAWFAAAYGYETPAFSPIDATVDRETFRTFTHSLTGLYYLIPPQAWLDNAPPLLRNWLEVDDKAVDNYQGVLNQLGAFKANASLARKVSVNQAEHIV